MQHTNRFYKLSLVVVAGVLASAIGCSDPVETTTSNSTGSQSSSSSSSSGEAGQGGVGGNGSGGMGQGGMGQGGMGQGGAGGAVVMDATLEGNVSRTAMIQPGLDGKGTLYIAVFNDNPIINMMAMPVGNAVIMNADFSMAGAMVPYQVKGIMPSPNPRYVVAFLDDDANADPANPAPKKPDLVTLDGIGPVQVTLAQPGTTTKDLVLNAVMPF